MTGWARIERPAECILNELRRGAGLGGLDRTFRDNAQRARVDIARTVRHDPDQITDLDLLPFA